MDVVQFPTAAPPAASTPFARVEAAVGITEVAGVMPRTAEMPLPFPATFGQAGEVNKSRMGEAVVGVDTDIAPERVMKPWGLPMLPDLSKEDAAQEEIETDSEPEPEPAEVATLPVDTKTESNSKPVEQEAQSAVKPAPEDPAQAPTDPFADTEAPT